MIGTLQEQLVWTGNFRRENSKHSAAIDAILDELRDYIELKSKLKDIDNRITAGDFWGPQWRDIVDKL